jgi:hypothetical protein
MRAHRSSTAGATEVPSPEPRTRSASISGRNGTLSVSGRATSRQHRHTGGASVVDRLGDQPRLAHASLTDEHDRALPKPRNERLHQPRQFRLPAHQGRRRSHAIQQSRPHRQASNGYPARGADSELRSRPGDGWVDTRSDTACL